MMKSFPPKLIHIHLKKYKKNPNLVVTYIYSSGVIYRFIYSFQPPAF